jgi:competence protein ComEA
MLKSLATGLAFSAALLAAGAVILPAAAQDLLPEGPGRETTVRVCSGCHDVDFFLGVPRSRTGWETSMIKMMNRGLNISSADYTTIAVYLSTYIGTGPRPAPVPIPAATETPPPS